MFPDCLGRYRGNLSLNRNQTWVPGFDEAFHVVLIKITPRTPRHTARKETQRKATFNILCQFLLPGRDFSQKMNRIQTAVERIAKRVVEQHDAGARLR